MLGGISIWQLLILLAIVVMVFGTKRLRNMGGDLGSALKDFRSAMKHGEDDDSDKSTSDEGHKPSSQSRVIEQDGDDSKRHTDETASRDHSS